MSGSETLYTARFNGPEILESGRINTITASIYRDGSLATLTQSGSTITIWDANNVKVVDAAAVTVTANVASYAVSAAVAVSTSISDGWRFEWSLVIGGTTYVFRRDGSLVYRRLYPVVTDADLLRSHTDLTTRRPSSETSYQDYLDEAWARIESKLVNTGKRPWLIMSPSALRDVLTYKTLELVFRDFATGGPGSAEWAMMEKYEGLFAAAWGELTYPQASATDGAATDTTKRTSGSSTVWLGAAPFAGGRY